MKEDGPAPACAGRFLFCGEASRKIKIPVCPIRRNRERTAMRTARTLELFLGGVG